VKLYAPTIADEMPRAKTRANHDNLSNVAFEQLLDRESPIVSRVKITYL